MTIDRYIIAEENEYGEYLTAPLDHMINELGSNGECVELLFTSEALAEEYIEKFSLPRYEVKIKKVEVAYEW